MKALALALCALALFSYTLTAPLAAKPTNCIGCNFADANLQGRDFQNVDYVGANFRGADLRNANFSGAKLTGANFRDADLRGANFANVNCTGCELRGARLSGARLDGIKFTGADLRDVLQGMNDAELRAVLHNCTGCNLRGAQLSGHDLSNIEVIGANMEDVNAASARFTNAKLVGVNFRNANLRSTDFTNAAVCWHNTTETDGVVIERNTDCVRLSGADVHGAKFTGAQLCDSSHRGWNCSVSDAATIRRYSDSSLEGAILP